MRAQSLLLGIATFVVVALVTHALMPHRSRQQPGAGPYVPQPQQLKDAAGNPTLPVPPLAQYTPEFQRMQPKPPQSIELVIENTSLANVEDFYIAELQKRGFREEKELPAILRRNSTRGGNAETAALDRAATAVPRRIFINANSTQQAILDCRPHYKALEAFLRDPSQTVYPREKKADSITLSLRLGSLKPGDIPATLARIEAEDCLKELSAGAKTPLPQAEFEAQAIKLHNEYQNAAGHDGGKDVPRCLGRLSRFLALHVPQLTRRNGDDSFIELSRAVADILQNLPELRREKLTTAEAWRICMSALREK